VPGALMVSRQNTLLMYARQRERSAPCLQRHGQRAGFQKQQPQLRLRLPACTGHVAAAASAGAPNSSALTHAAAHFGRLARRTLRQHSFTIEHVTDHAMVSHYAALFMPHPTSYPKSPTQSMLKQATPCVFVTPYIPTSHAGAAVRRALAGAGTRPCGPRARRVSGTPVSSSARCCSRSTAAAAGPPPSGRTGCGTCAYTCARESELREH